MDEAILRDLMNDPAVSSFAPVVERRLKLANGDLVRLLGIDPFLDRAIRPEISRAPFGERSGGITEGLSCLPHRRAGRPARREPCPRTRPCKRWCTRHPEGPPQGDRHLSKPLRRASHPHGHRPCPEAARAAGEDRPRRSHPLRRKRLCLPLARGLPDPVQAPAAGDIRRHGGGLPAQPGGALAHGPLRERLSDLQHGHVCRREPAARRGSPAEPGRKPGRSRQGLPDRNRPLRHPWRASRQRCSGFF